MSGLLACLGFPVETEEEFYALIEQTVERGERVETGSGAYHRWEVGEGIELWAQENEDGELIGLNPHFAGEGLASLILDRAYNWAEAEDEEEAAGNPMDGGFVASPVYPEAVPAEEELAFAFDTPDHLVYGPLQLPGLFGVQLAAFGQEVVVFPDESAYLAEPANREFGTQNFLPLNLYSEEGEPLSLPQAEAVFAGKVVDTGRRTNPETGRTFVWARVQTDDLLLDVVIDPDDLEERLEPDAIVQGQFWVSGRLIDP